MERRGAGADGDAMLDAQIVGEIALELHCFGAGAEPPGFYGVKDFVDLILPYRRAAEYEEFFSHEWLPEKVGVGERE
jgi:hypothetical protein